MKTIKGPGLFLAQFAGDERAVQLARRDLPLGGLSRLQGRADPDLGRAPVRPRRRPPNRKAYCDEIKGTLRRHGVEITELSTHLQGQLVAVHPAYRRGLRRLRGAGGARQSEGAPGMGGRADACWRRRPRSNLGLDATSPSPARSPGPSLSLAAAAGRPGRDRLRRAGEALAADPRRLRRGRRRRLLRDPSRRGPARRRHLRDVPRARSATIRAPASTTTRSHFVLQQLDYLDYIDIYHERIKAFHVKDAEFNPTGRQGVYGGYAELDRPRRPLPLARRRPGRFQRDLLQARRSTTTTAGPCSNGSAASSIPRTARAKARSSSRHHIIRVTEKAFDDFAGGGTDEAANRRMLGLDAEAQGGSER